MAREKVTIYSRFESIEVNRQDFHEAIITEFPNGEECEIQDEDGTKYRLSLSLAETKESSPHPPEGDNQK